MFSKNYAITADAECPAHIAYNDSFPVHRELLKDGILLCLQIAFFTPSTPQQNHKRTTIVTHNGLDQFLRRCLWQKNVIKAHPKCQTHIAHNYLFPVHRQLVQDGILLCLQKCSFQLPSDRLEAATISCQRKYRIMISLEWLFNLRQL